MPRAFLIVIDSVGCGGAPDAAASSTARTRHRRQHAGPYRPGLRGGPRRGAGAAGRCRCRISTRWGWGRRCGWPRAMPTPGLGATPTGLWGAATEVSNGKDTPSGHWELAGVPVPWDWHYFPDDRPGLSRRPGGRGLPAAPAPTGILGNCHASGTLIIEEQGAEHIAHRLADLLHLGRQRVPDRRARGALRAGAAAGALRDRLPRPCTR